MINYVLTKNLVLTNKIEEINASTQEFKASMTSEMKDPYDNPEQNLLPQNELDEVKFLSAFGGLVKCFIPSSLSLLLEYGVFLLNLVFAGLNDDAAEISGCGLGLLTNNIVVFMLSTGL